MKNGIPRIGEISKDGVFLYDLQTARFSYVNEPFAQLFQLGKEEMLNDPGLVLPAIFTEDHAFLYQRYDELKETKSLSNTEFRLQLPDNLVRHLSLDSYLFDDLSVIAGFVKDVTNEKQHEDYIINYGAKKDTLLDMMSHNLSGPLHLSGDLLSWVQKNYNNKEPEVISSQLQMVKDTTEYCLEIVNDFLRQEHLESEHIYIKKTRFDIIDRIVATLDKLVVTNRDKKFNLVTELKSANITTDSVKFFQIIHNLVSNAIKFTPANGTIDIIVEETDKLFVVRVRDNGIGIPVHLHGQLFDKRTLASRKGLTKQNSSGLGLSIVKTLTDLLGGNVYFETTEGKGSVFSIELLKE